MWKRMKIIKERKQSKKIKGLEKIKLDTFQDYRGEIWTVYSKEYSDDSFVADKISISRFGVLRGFHGDSYTTKMISCLHGQFQLAVADLRKGSSTYGINAHLSLSDKCLFYYKWSEHYRGPEAQVTVAWNDPDLNIDWAVQNPTLSERDKKGIKFEGVTL